ncbi:MAG: ankyrin repeat domain-containing protein [Gemmataceae bacterium]|nr:ankyrin repeat domain-containing protein [Gemmataceae bacterium]MCI0743555.1 ankyrin repeat domain-containing protein [Gemmataceae bacterium]
MQRVWYWIGSIIVASLVIGAFITVKRFSNAVQKESRTAEIHHYSGLGDTARVRSLLEEDHTLVDALRDPLSGETPLHTSAKMGHLGVVKLLLEKGAIVDSRETVFSHTPLHAAAENGHEHIIDLLCQFKADINAKSRDGDTALTVAASRGHAKAIQALIRNGATVKPETENAVSALEFAAMAGHLEVARILLDNGAEIDAGRLNVNSITSFSPLFHAAMNGHEHVAAFLLEKGAKKDLFSAAALGDKDFVAQKIRENPALAHSTLDYGPNSLLHVAAKYGRRGVVELLLAKKASPNFNVRGTMPMHLAAENGHVEVIEALLHNGANADVGDLDGNTPLHRAVRNNKFKAAKSLLATLGALANARNAVLRTPLHYAITYETDTQLVAMLVECGSDPNAKDKNGDTPISLARHNRNANEYLKILQAEQ